MHCGTTRCGLRSRLGWTCLNWYLSASPEKEDHNDAFDPSTAANPAIIAILSRLQLAVTPRQHDHSDRQRSTDKAQILLASSVLCSLLQWPFSLLRDLLIRLGWHRHITRCADCSCLSLLCAFGMHPAASLALAVSWLLSLLPLSPDMYHTRRKRASVVVCFLSFTLSPSVYTVAPSEFMFSFRASCRLLNMISACLQMLRCCHFWFAVSVSL